MNKENAPGSTLKSRSTVVEDHYRVTQNQVANLAVTNTIIEAITAFTSGFEQLEVEMLESGPAPEQLIDDLTIYYSEEFQARIDREINISDYLRVSSAERLAQWVYFVQNPNPVGEKNAAYTPQISTTYQSAHDRFHTQMNRYLQSFDFYDVFLYDKSARLVYSSRKETNFATSFNSGPYATSNLGDTVRTALMIDHAA